MYDRFIGTLVFIYTINNTYKGKLNCVSDEYIELELSNNEIVRINKINVVSISNSMEIN